MRQEMSRGSASALLNVAVNTIVAPSGAAASSDSDSSAPTRTLNVPVVLSPAGSVAVTVTVASPGRMPRILAAPEATHTETAPSSDDAE